jgi:hypothetical protein
MDHPVTPRNLEQAKTDLIHGTESPGLLPFELPLEGDVSQMSTIELHPSPSALDCNIKLSAQVGNTWIGEVGGEEAGV